MEEIKCTKSGLPIPESELFEYWQDRLFFSFDHTQCCITQNCYSGEPDIPINATDRKVISAIAYLFFMEQGQSDYANIWRNWGNKK